MEIKSPFDFFTEEQVDTFTTLYLWVLVVFVLMVAGLLALSGFWI